MYMIRKAFSSDRLRRAPRWCRPQHWRRHILAPLHFGGPQCSCTGGQGVGGFL